jgi:ferredoxin-NADP reductase
MGIRDRGFHPLRVARVVAETPEASTFVLDVPDSFAYEAGQFCTFKVPAGGEELQRCYSMSSMPGEPFAVTVKRVPCGAASNWLLDHVAEGSVLEASAPTGLFRLPPGDADVVAFAAGSGITPVWSVVKAALATTGRRVRLLYANRDRASVIFADAIAAAASDRFEVVHHLDVEDGFVDPDAVRPFADPAADAFVCGPGPFMDVVESTLLGAGVPADRIRIERFSAFEPVPDGDAAADGTEVTIEVAGKRGTTEHRAGTTILQVARQLGLPAPSSCESGSCATCMAMLVEGEVHMRTNNALTPEEVDEGWILTCQSVPTSPSVRVVYE